MKTKIPFRIKIFLFAFAVIALISIGVGCTALFGQKTPNVSLFISSIALLGTASSVLGHYLNLKKDFLNSLPEILLIYNQDRYSVGQLEFKNVGNTTAYITDLESSEQLYTFDNPEEFLINDLIKECVLPPGCSVKYPFLFYKDKMKDEHFRNITGNILFKNKDSIELKNKISLNLKPLQKTLKYSNEITKASYNITGISKSMEEISKTLNKINSKID
ncbi:MULTISPECIES: hypothetical protein [Bacillus]|uniref:hypothetical protein n=1 Tax=Bacillus TaxID=1386 RepID=UPI0009B7CC1E|nr:MULTISPECIES: hypothetical protein [Bacillus]ARC68699.1 hypothetical protein B34_01257 [Bacillus licheniformis]MBU8681986.1 hypothetical protein [Bacillus haynesii]MCY8641255.1 hypothetical protein [Bacillus haynesii]MEC0491451.1 hypothetical protein [Bacillus licheniformis]QEO07826.1 hypothetical protein FLQ07_20775 [Bacillus paralicheniformis]